MYNYTDIVGKRAIALYEARNLGVISAVITDKSLSKLRYFAVKQDDGSELFFPFNAISSFSLDAVTLKNCQKVKSRFDLTPPFSCAPVGSEVFSYDGKLLGKIDDISFDNSKIVCLKVGELAFSASKILSQSDSLLIVNDGNEKIRLVAPTLEKPIEKVDDIEKENPPVESSENSEQETPVAPAPTMPQKGSVTVSSVTQSDTENLSAFAFLLGRTATKDLLAPTGEIILREGEVINENALTDARKYDKLVQLALYSK